MLNSIYRLLRLKKLTHRLFFWVIIFIFISSSIFLAIYIHSDRKERISRADAQLQRTLVNQKEIIESWASDRMEQLMYLSTLEPVKHLDEEKMYETFTNYTSFSLELEALFFVDEFGDIVVDSTSDSIEPEYTLNLKDKPYFIAGEEGTTSMENMYVTLQDDTSVILFSVPVYGESEQFNGIVLGAVSLNKISDLLKLTNLGISGETFLVNDTIELLLDVNHGELNRSAINSIDTDVTNAIIQGESPPKLYRNERGKTVLGHYSSLFNEQFYVIHEIRLDEVLKTHIKMVWTIVLIGICIFILAILLISLVLRDIQHSIVNFTSALQVIKDGDYAYAFDENVYKNSSIEIQEAMDVFNSMAKTLQENKKELMWLSEADPLTGVNNRRTFMKVLKETWQTAFENKQVISIAFLDIDYFKQLNDTYGHPVGDQVLIRITQLMNSCLEGTTGTLYRYGGEEFIILFPETDEKATYEIAEKICREVEQTIFIQENTSNVTVSIGVTSTIPTELGLESTFVKEADDALYQAKRSGRNQVQAVHYPIKNPSNV